MSDRKKDLYEPGVRSLDREEPEVERSDSESHRALHFVPRVRIRPTTSGVVIMLPTEHEVLLVPGPDTLQ